MPLSTKQLRGTFTAIVTPFTEDTLAVDYDSLGKLLDFQLSNKIDGIVACGSTGEAATLSDDEFRKVVGFVVEHLKGRVPCIVGVNSSSTERACGIARGVSELGADGILLVAPPYNKPSQLGITQHFQNVHRAVSLPIVAYNIPGRTSVNILPPTLKQLAEDGIIIGVKESSGSLDQVIDLLALTGDKASVLSGEDSLVLASMVCGAKGVISASANVVPDLFVEMTSAALSSKWDKARQAQFKLLPIVRAMFLETNPVPVKAALAMKGIIKSGMVRLPLLAATEDTIGKVEEILFKY